MRTTDLPSALCPVTTRRMGLAICGSSPDVG
jgi:hypothetical protein